MSTVSEYTRVYTGAGTVGHALDTDQSPNEVEAEALCGRTAWPNLWLGTGSQEEHETAWELPPCTPCQAIIRYRNMGAMPPEWETRG